MAYYTDDPIGNTDLSLLDAPSSFGEALSAGFQQSLSTSITPLLLESLDLQEQTQGKYVYSPSRQNDILVSGPATPMLSKQDADERVKESGLEVDVPESGIREGALNLLLERRREERERQIVLNNAPSGSAPAVIAAQFAAQMIDPINIASAFIPVVGEARYSAMLARATTFGGRAAVRVGVGAAEGAVGAAVLEPFVYTLSNQLQDDYDLTDSLENVLFGAALGGGLRGVGGAILDRIKAPKDVTGALDDVPDSVRPTLESAVSRERQLRADAETARLVVDPTDADVRAIASENVTPSFRAELEALAAGKIPNVADLRKDVADIDKKLASLPDTFKDRAKGFQAEGMSRKQAERAAREAIEAERIELTTRRNDAEQALDKNRAAEQARSDLAMLDRGETPPRLATKIDAEAVKVSKGFERTKLSESIPFAERADLFHKTLGAEMNGIQVDPRAFVDIKSPDPEVRQRAIDQIKSAPTKMSAEYGKFSERASANASQAAKADDALQAELAEFDEATLREVADQTGYNLKDDVDIREADAFALEVEAYQDVYRANALCMLRG